MGFWTEILKKPLLMKNYGHMSFISLNGFGKKSATTTKKVPL